MYYKKRDFVCVRVFVFLVGYKNGDFSVKVIWFLYELFIICWNI